MVSTSQLSNILSKMVNQNKEELIKVYDGLKRMMSEELHSETLRKYNILSQAFKIGKKIHGSYFTKQQLSKDFEIPYTTINRILSLDKANEKTWDRINSGKITSYKAAQVLMQKNVYLQDKLIEVVIEDNLSTYQIKNMKDKSLEDIKQDRLRRAVKDGFARKETALFSFNATLGKLKQLLLLKKEYLPKNKLPELRRNLVRVREMLDSYIKELGEDTE